MRKWLILAGVIIGIWLIALVSYLLVAGNSAETNIELLESENVKLRVVAENRELLWKIAVLENNLQGKPATKQPKITPVPSGANVDIKPK